MIEWKEDLLVRRDLIEVMQVIIYEHISVKERANAKALR